ncbi:MAG TPA: group 1 truncated hemoglobin [Acidobacteriota bacterium]
MMTRRKAAVAILLLASLFACRRHDTLYDRLGGDVGISLLVQDFLDRFIKDPRLENPQVKKRHEAAHYPALKEHWIRFFTKATGGPDRYEGRSLRLAHAGLGITGKEFEIMIQILAESLAQSNIPKDAQQDLLRLIRSYRSEVVEKPLQ